ncbi:HNH endonuclease [Caballeronia grimmiae]|uniref:HNH endonuclease n=1 Tax=Caballeronia grimmiae TaxID=1071679 RepID=UPI0038BA216A
MDIKHWINNDEGYVNWVTNYPAGYLANIKRNRKNDSESGVLVKIHLASHKLADRSNPNSSNPWTGNDYTKVTSESLVNLLAWLESHSFEISPDKYCITCDLRGDASHHLSVPIYPDEIPADQPPFIEGATRQVLVNQYERDRRARSACIRHWGTACYVCGFDFQKAYGTMGCGFIHVHHLTDIASIGAEYEVDPRADLRPVCPNCHAMLHTERPAIDIHALKSMLAARQAIDRAIG